MSEKFADAIRDGDAKRINDLLETVINWHLVWTQLEDPRVAAHADLDRLIVKAANINLENLVGKLLEMGADPHAVDEKGRTLLQITRSTEIKRLVRAARTAALLESAMPDAEVEPSTPSSSGMPPL